ncbi:MAG: hypothetical protein JNL02_11365 [Saprospiraceae bacterium]|nr:hypothetical protein [Saprospiraceae bacterium]
MKYTFTLLAFLSLALAPATAQNLLLPLLADSSHWYYYDYNTGTQQNHSETYWYYNADHLETSSFSQSFWTGSPAYYFRDTTIYDADDRPVLFIGLKSTPNPEGPWENWIRDEYEYDAQSRLAHILGAYGSAGVWVPYYDISYNFDDVAHTENMLYLLWNPGTQQWDNYTREFTQRTPDGKVLEFDREDWDEDANQWAIVESEDYTYQPDGRLLVKHRYSISSNDVETFNTDSSIYRPDGLLDSTFFTNIIPEYFINGLFVTRYYYDAEGQLDSSLTVVSNDGGLSFSPSSRQYFEPGDGYYSNDYTYESNDVIVNGAYAPNWVTTKVFTPLGNDRVLYVETYLQAIPGDLLKPNTIDSTWYRSPDAVGTGDLSQLPSCTCQFANPFRSGQAIRCETADTRSALSYRLTDMNGRVVAAGTALPGSPWHPAMQAPEGAYQLGVWQKGVFLGSRKLVLSN